VTAFTDQPDVHLEPIDLAHVPDKLRDAASRAGWTSLMPVQARAIPYLLAGHNAIIQARTGSGKTGAFVLPMLERIDAAQPHPQVLVLVPTRELARQVWLEAGRLCSDAGLRTVAVYGGVGYGQQMDALRGGAQVVVGTPGRILDLLLRRSLTFDRIRMVVYDEADRMLSMGFYPDMKKLQRYLPDRHIHTSMFSATFPESVIRVAREFIREPIFITLSADHVHVTETAHIFYNVPAMDKDRALIRLIEIENPTSAIIFCNTKDRVHYVSMILQRFGYDADEISADLTQNQRELVLERVRKGTLRFLIATDVAARGLDIPELSHVIQYEVPEDPEAYIHRAGRTGRAGASGVALTLASGIESVNLSRIAKQFSIEMTERPVPTDADVEAVVAERVTALLEARLRDRGALQTERSRRFLSLARDLAESEDESAIIAMLLDEYYQQSLHAPAPQPPGTVEPPPPRRQHSGPPPGQGNRRRGRRRR
jgi:ATP-dependent RNA helicase DeaD